MKSSIGSIIAISILSTSTLAQVTRNYNCNNQPIICSNICYWQICVHPTQQVYTYDPQGPVDQRRIDCGVTPDPSSRQRPCLGLVGGGPGMETDEFPFASMAEGGRTPFGDGASLMCTTSNEQRVQGGVVRQLYAPLNAGDQFQLALTNTNGIAYCDPSATPNPGSCNGLDFAGFHFFPDIGAYCQWNVDVPQGQQVTCIDADDGSQVDPPAKLRLRAMEAPRAANWSALLHIRDPELMARLPVEQPVAIPFEA